MEAHISSDKLPEDLMKKSLVLVSFVFLVAMTIPSQSFSMGIEAAVGVWEQSPAGELAFEELSDFDFLDLEDDLRYDDETRLFARLCRSEGKPPPVRGSRTSRATAAPARRAASA